MNLFGKILERNNSYNYYKDQNDILKLKLKKQMEANGELKTNLENKNEKYENPLEEFFTTEFRVIHKPIDYFNLYHSHFENFINKKKLMY
jgi:hypothetical protein